MHISRRSSECYRDERLEKNKKINHVMFFVTKAELKMTSFCTTRKCGGAN